MNLPEKCSIETQTDDQTTIHSETSTWPKQMRSIAIQTKLPYDSDEKYHMCNRQCNGSTSTTEVQVSLAPPNKQLTTERGRGFYGFKSVKTDEELNNLCGVTLSVFNLLLKTLPQIVNRKSSKENKSMIFLMKLKLGLTSASLSVIFYVYRTTISRNFISILDSLSVSM